MDNLRERSEWPTPGFEQPGQLGDESGRTNLSQDLSPASLRGCAARCRDFAERQPDPRRAELFRGLAASFEQHASIKERRLTARDF